MVVNDSAKILTTLYIITNHIINDHKLCGEIYDFDISGSRMVNDSMARIIMDAEVYGFRKENSSWYFNDSFWMFTKCNLRSISFFRKVELVRKCCDL